jgi:PAS domain S-box-containing protein
MPAKNTQEILQDDIAKLKIELSATREKSQIQLEALTYSQHLANIGTWDLDHRTNKLSWSDQVYEIFGLDSRNFCATYESFLDSIHPDDRDMVNRVYSEAVATNTPYEVVHRVLRPDGQVRVVREKSKDIRDDDGNLIRSMGIVHDITEQQAEHKVLEEKERFLATAMANLPGLV